MSNTRVLLISCYFPPTGGVQVQRALSLAKYMPDCGVDLHVLTTSNPSVPTFDHALVKQVPSSVTVHRAMTLEPPFQLRKKVWSSIKRPSTKGPAATAVPAKQGGLLASIKHSISDKIARTLCPDPQVLWYPMAIRAADKIVREHKIQAIVVTAPPFSALLLGNELKRRYPHVALLTDIRDEWITYFSKTFAFAGNDYVMRKAVEIERATVELSDRIVPVSKSCRDEMLGRYPDQPASKFHIVPNGFDPAAFQRFQSRPHGLDKIVLTYTGTIYTPASPAGFLDALDSLPEAVRSRFEVRFIGRLAEELDPGMLQNRKSQVRYLGFVSQQEALRYMEESDYLLLPWADHLNIPGKLYEYIVADKPIIAITKPEADAAELIRNTGSGWCVDRSDPSAIQELLTRIARGNASGDLVRNEAAIRRFERPKLAREYAELIAECLEPRRKPVSVAVPEMVGAGRKEIV